MVNDHDKQGNVIPTGDRGHALALLFIQMGGINVITIKEKTEVEEINAVKPFDIYRHCFYISNSKMQILGES